MSEPQVACWQTENFTSAKEYKEHQALPIILNVSYEFSHLRNGYYALDWTEVRGSAPDR
jgi:hypothetical protein